jgi:hypothetical protein
MVFKAKGRLRPKNMPPAEATVPPQNRRKRGGPDLPGPATDTESEAGAAPRPASSRPAPALGRSAPRGRALAPLARSLERGFRALRLRSGIGDRELSLCRVLRKWSSCRRRRGLGLCLRSPCMRRTTARCAASSAASGSAAREALHILACAAIYSTTSHGVFETEMPEWAVERWEWERAP